MPYMINGKRDYKPPISEVRREAVGEEGPSGEEPGTP